MKRSKWLSGVGGVAACALWIGCGSGEDRSTATAPSPSAPGEAEAPEVASPAPPAASAVQTCIELADQQAWEKALDPCTQAAAERPDDLRIRHALQQAQAAAADTLAN